jgi:hypothetical protein
MGVSRSPQELAAKLNRYAVEVGRANRTGVEAAALAVKRTTEPLVRNATGGDMKLSGVGAVGSKRPGRKIGVRYDVRGNEDATAIVRATGPAPLIERDQVDHYIFPRAARAQGQKARTQTFAVGFTAGGRKKYRRVDRRNVTAELGGRVNVGRSALMFTIGGKEIHRPFVKVKGSKGRKPFERGFAKGETIAPAEYAKAQRQAMLSVFK